MQRLGAAILRRLGQKRLCGWRRARSRKTGSASAESSDLTGTGTGDACGDACVRHSPRENDQGVWSMKRKKPPHANSFDIRPGVGSW